MFILLHVLLIYIWTGTSKNEILLIIMHNKLVYSLKYFNKNDI